MQAGIRTRDGVRFMSMSGRVSLDNNGGFIQVRLPLARQGSSYFDASAYEGLRIVARANEREGYYTFLRGTANRFPWSFYMAPMSVGQEWTEVRIPFAAFVRGDFGAAFDLNVRRLSSVAVVAYKKEFEASIDVRELSFY